MPARIRASDELEQSGATRLRLSPHRGLAVGADAVFTAVRAADVVQFLIAVDLRPHHERVRIVGGLAADGTVVGRIVSHGASQEKRCLTNIP
jgi:hypothetical protein